MNEVINIMHISVRADRGGGPKHIIDLISSSDGFGFHFISAPSFGHHVNDFKKISKGYCVIPYRSFKFDALISLIIFLRVNKIDIIHSHGRGAGTYSRLAGMILGLPVIHTHHGLYLEKYSGFIKKFMIKLERALNKLTCRIVFVSQSELLACVAAGAFDERKSVIIPNCVAVPKNFANAVKKKNSIFQLITITRLEAEKGNSHLIDIMAELVLYKQQFKLTIVGEGPEREVLQKKIFDKGLEKVVSLIGPRDDVHVLLENADAYITASLGEAQGIAILEAMSHALPVIASRVRGHIDMIIEGANGVLFDIGDSASAALKIIAIISDQHLSERLGQNGRQLVIENYSLELMAKRIRLLYQEVKNMQNAS